MNDLLSWLNQAMSGAPWVAVVAAAGWGVASLVLSPCHLASIPLIVGFIAERREATSRQAWGCSLLFALGILVSIAAIGALTAVAGRMLGDIGPWANYAVAIVLALVGIHLLGWIELPWDRWLPRPTARGKTAAFLLGVVFGVALGPCTFAYLAPVLGVVFAVADSQPGFAAMLLLAYALGHCVLIVAAGVSTERVQAVLNWNERSRGARGLKIGCGLLVLGGAVWLVVTAPVSGAG